MFAFPKRISPAETALRLAAIVDYVLNPATPSSIIGGIGLVRLTQADHGRNAVQVWWGQGEIPGSIACVLCVEDKTRVTIYRPGAWEAKVEALRRPDPQVLEALNDLAGKMLTLLCEQAQVLNDLDIESGVLDMTYSTLVIFTQRVKEIRSANGPHSH